jgi:hypothetical protein
VDGQIVLAITGTCGIPPIAASPGEFKSFKELVVQNWVRGR